MASPRPRANQSKSREPDPYGSIPADDMLRDLPQTNKAVPNVLDLVQRRRRQGSRSTANGEEARLTVIPEGSSRMATPDNFYRPVDREDLYGHQGRAPYNHPYLTSSAGRPWSPPRSPVAGSAHDLSHAAAGSTADGARQPDVGQCPCHCSHPPVSEPQEWAEHFDAKINQLRDELQAQAQAQGTFNEQHRQQTAAIRQVLEDPQPMDRISRILQQNSAQSDSRVEKLLQDQTSATVQGLADSLDRWGPQIIEVVGDVGNTVEASRQQTLASLSTMQGAVGNVRNTVEAARKETAASLTSIQKCVDRNDTEFRRFRDEIGGFAAQSTNQYDMRLTTIEALINGLVQRVSADNTGVDTLLRALGSGVSSIKEEVLAIKDRAACAGTAGELIAGIGQHQTALETKIPLLVKDLAALVERDRAERAIQGEQLSHVVLNLVRSEMHQVHYDTRRLVGDMLANVSDRMSNIDSIAVQGRNALNSGF